MVKSGGITMQTFKTLFQRRIKLNEAPHSARCRSCYKNLPRKFRLRTYGSSNSGKVIYRKKDCRRKYLSKAKAVSVMN